MARIVGTSGHDVLRGTSHRDVIIGKGGNDKIIGRGRNDKLKGGKGNDKINASPCSDLLDGGLGIRFEAGDGFHTGFRTNPPDSGARSESMGGSRHYPMLGAVRELWDEGTPGAKREAAKIAKDAAPYVYPRLTRIHQTIHEFQQFVILAPEPARERRREENMVEGASRRAKETISTFKQALEDGRPADGGVPAHGRGKWNPGPDN